jgi:hypothetical protein
MDYHQETQKMALTAFQVEVLKLLTMHRGYEDASYCAGGAALNHQLATPRLSQDLDLFHDTTEALWATWNYDRSTLTTNGYAVKIIREATSFVEVEVDKNGETLIIQWVRDSAFRFFPLVRDAVLGNTLHPVDLATNKLCALASRLEPRDWIDTLACHQHIQHFGYLLWAACGKDPGLNPEMLLNDARRLHYSQAEIDILYFKDYHPNASKLGLEWKEACTAAAAIIARLPEEHAGECVMADKTMLYSGNPAQIEDDIKQGRALFHKGSIRGAWPVVVESSQ